MGVTKLPRARVFGHRPGAAALAWARLRLARAARAMAPKLLPLGVSVALTTTIFLGLTHLSRPAHQVGHDGAPQLRAWLRLAPATAAAPPALAPIAPAR